MAAAVEKDAAKVLFESDTRMSNHRFSPDSRRCS